MADTFIRHTRRRSIPNLFSRQSGTDHDLFCRTIIKPPAAQNKCDADPISFLISFRDTCMAVLIELLMRLLAIPLSPKVRGKRLVIATRLIKQLAIPLSNQPKNFWPGTRKTVAKWLVISCQKSTAKSLVIRVSGITRRAGSCLQGRFRKRASLRTPPRCCRDSSSMPLPSC
jgi:hypothetical protein